MIEKIEILQHRESCNFGCHPCEEAWWLLGIVAYHHQMVVELGEYRLNSLSELLVSSPSIAFAMALRMFSSSRRFCFLRWLNYRRVIRSGMVLGHSLPRRVKKIVLTIDTECFRRDGKCYYFQIGKIGYDTTMRDVSSLIYLISCILFADFKNFSELFDEVVHSNDNSTLWFRKSQVAKN